ncbi:MAG: aldehyde dehydrogenase family protein [Phycisphaerales bacterium]|nr:aldehyde dehydrogenase family protein [Phycisphaerales bacterium]
MSTAAAITTRFSSINPANGQVVGEITATTIEAIPELVAKAKRAQVAWGALTASARNSMRCLTDQLQTCSGIKNTA